ncbi:response regulator [Parvularcula sp. LCG005]|uniref:response regulator n=1 Tax=Parvularcula sp. LCG005 TaxID=3078805 RepID=UPI0029430064|nr:response regulator [Parvularcula sp. LCG005]WOI54157.1 response regulator [Parvularcula sp. LCG005]
MTEQPVVTGNDAVGDDIPHILIVDDDDKLRRLIARYLRENGFLASTADDAAHADAIMANLTFDALVVDVMMPGENGLDMTRRLRERSNIPILVLTARGQPEDRVEGLEAGADDYLPKPFEPRELVLRLQRLLSRRDYTPRQETVTFGPNVFTPRRGELRRNGEAIKLTGAELALLRTLTAKPGATFSRATLAEQTGTGFDRSIDVQVTRLRRKIEDDPRMPVYLQTVRGVGYVLVVD